MKKLLICLVALIIACCLGSVGYMIYANINSDRKIDTQAVFAKMLAFENNFKKNPTNITIDIEITQGDNTSSAWLTWDYENNIGALDQYYRVTKTDEGYVYTGYDNTSNDCDETDVAACSAEATGLVCFVSEEIGYKGTLLKGFVDNIVEKTEGAKLVDYTATAKKIKNGYIFNAVVSYSIGEGTTEVITTEIVFENNKYTSYSLERAISGGESRKQCYKINYGVFDETKYNAWQPRQK